MEKKPPGASALSTLTIVTIGLLSRLFLYTTQRTTVEGLHPFLTLLDARRKGEHKRGLLTVSNHKSVIDDPVLWGTLSPRYLIPARHALGSSDICFANPVSNAFFSLGQVHPTHRLHKSPLGGLFQPTLDSLPALLSPPTCGWVHIFPEGRVHQHPAHQMRYFKWGVSRLILEPAIQPVFVPMFITGFEDIMSESRTFPRFLPRLGKRVRVIYGDAVPDSRFEDVRQDWKALWHREGGGTVGESDILRTGKEAVRLRIETTRRVREEVVKLRRRLRYPEEAPGASDPATYRLPGMAAKEGRLLDDSRVKDT